MGYTPPFLNVNYLSGSANIRPAQGTHDDFVIYANNSDSTGAIAIYGLGRIILTVASGSYVEIKDGTTSYGKISYSSPDMIIESTVADKNISLKTAGTGVVKFGTYTAGAATDSTGYITILDAAGNTRKLMVQA